MIGNAPFAEPFRHREVNVRNDVVNALCHQVGTHVREIGIASVVVTNIVANTLQAPCN